MTLPAGSWWGRDLGGRARSGLVGKLCLLHAVVGLVLMPGTAVAQGSTPSSAAKVAPARSSTGSTVAKPAWAELSPTQQSALQPLAPSWASISEGQKRKWIALSRNFDRLSPTERATLHGHMSEWVNLSPVQRSQARLNFAQTKQLSNDEKKAQWKAYQALSPEQKQQLASGSHLPSGAAPALKPVDPKKLAAVPVTRSDAASAAGTSKPRLPAVTRDTPPAPRNAKPASAPGNPP